MSRQLKKNIEIKFGKPIRFQRDIKELKEDIYDVTGLIIGFNTLRRFFGFLNSVEPQRKTLNILSNYVGYGNYNKFLNKDKKNLLWDNWYYLNKFLKRDNFVESDFDWLLDLRSREFYYLLITKIIVDFFAVRSFKKLDVLFNCGGLFRGNRREVTAKITTSLNSEISYLKDKELKQIYFLLKNPVFRELALYSWVEMDSAKSHYGKLLHESKKYIDKDDERLFTHLYFLLVDFLDKKPIDFPFKLNVPKDCHPILLGRYWSMKLVCLPKERVTIVKNLRSIVQNIDTKNEFFQEIIPVLILLKDFNSIELIINEFYEELMDYTHWDHISIEQYNLVALALLYIKRGNLLSIEQLFEFFNVEEEFHHNNNYHKLFYSIALYHFRKKTSQKKILVDRAEKMYCDYAKKLGFKYFDTQFLITYFD